MHVHFPPSPLASIPRAHKGISWFLHPISAMSFLKSTFLKGILITTTQSLQVMKIATALYLFFICRMERAYENATISSWPMP